MHRYFEGWYFKQQSAQGTLALIPAMHVDSFGRKSASIQVVTEDAAYCCDVPWDDFRADRRNMHITAGNNHFSTAGIRLNIRTEGLMALGEFTFGPLSPLRYDIMGPFRFAPFMECRHSVFSMAHTVNGTVCINGKELLFENALGYLEGDRGHSFPKRYVWTQGIWREGGFGSLMLSVADIPFLGMKFTGIIGVVLLGGLEYRLATYLGAQVVQIENRGIEIKQGRLRLLVRQLDCGGLSLRAPVMGDMTRLIREAPSCRVYYRFERDGNVLLDKTVERAGFEYEYDT